MFANILINNLSMFKYKYLVTTLTNRSGFHNESMRRSVSGNASCYSNIPCTFKMMKINISKVIDLTVILYGSGMWSVTLKKEHKFQMFKNKVLRNVFVFKL